MKNNLKLILLIALIVLSFGGYFLYNNFINYRYMNGDYKNLCLGDSRELISKKLHYLTETKQILPPPSNNNLINKADFSIQYFDKRANVSLNYNAQNRLNRIYIVGSDYNELAAVQKDAQRLKMFFTRKYKKPVFEEDFREYRISTSRYVEYIVGRWRNKNRLVQLEVFFFDEKPTGMGGYTIIISTAIPSKKRMEVILKKDFN